MVRLRRFRLQLQSTHEKELPSLDYALWDYATFLSLSSFLLDMSY